MNEELKAKLTELGLTEEQLAKLESEGATSEEDLGRLNADEIRTLTECGLVTAKKVAEAFAPVPTAAISAFSPTVALNVLPPVPGDESWLSALKIGGILKFNKETVIGTVSAALAAKVGLYELPKQLSVVMERYAESLDEPVSPEYFEMQRMLAEHNYADLFAALPGVTGAYATNTRRTQLLSRLETNLWPALIEFQGMLNGWFDSWQKAYANPAVMMTSITQMISGGGAMMPPGMMAPPPTDALHDSAENVVNAINRVFAGTGIPVAMALAYDAQQIRRTLEHPSLPAQVGAANREQMLKLLGVAVNSDYPRLELNLKQYTLGIVELPNVTAGQTELAYVTALYQLGAQIDWAKLGSAPSRPYSGDGSVGDVLFGGSPFREPARITGDRVRQ